MAGTALPVRTDAGPLEAIEVEKDNKLVLQEMVPKVVAEEGTMIVGKVMIDEVANVAAASDVIGSATVVGGDAALVVAVVGEVLSTRSGGGEKWQRTKRTIGQVKG